MGQGGALRDFIAIVDEEESFQSLKCDLGFPREIRERHILIDGRTGSGKTSKIILPMIWSDLCDPDKSLVILDPKGDLTGPVVEMANLARGGAANIRYISFGEPDFSLGWNPFEGVKDIGEAREIAQCLSSIAEVSEGKDSSFFRMQAEKLISSFIVGMQDSPGGCVPAHLVKLFDLPPSDLEKKARELGGAALSAIEYASGSNHNAETSLMGTQNCLAPFLDSNVAVTTATTEFSFQELDERPTVLILRCPEGIERLRPLSAIFIKRLFNWVVECADSRRSKRLSRMVCCYIDEFASALGRLPDMERVINTLRSRSFCFTAAIQSLAQLTQVYGEGTASVVFEGFGSLIYIPPGGLVDSNLFSERSGPTQIVQSEQLPGSYKFFREELVVRNRLTAMEIAFPAKHPDRGSLVTILTPEMSPIRGFPLAIYELPEFRSWDRLNGGDGAPARILEREAPLAIPSPEAYLAVNSGQRQNSNGISNVSGWSNDRIQEQISRVKISLDWENTTGSARKWWEAFEKENRKRSELVLRLAEELQNRKATITEFFLAYVYSNTDNIQANLCYLDYSRLKKGEEQKRREAAKKEERKRRDAAKKEERVEDLSEFDPFEDESDDD